MGDSAFGSPANNLVGFFANSTAVQNMHMVWGFQMTGITNPANITGANFFADATRLGSGYNLDVHVVRTAATNTVLASAYETSAGLLTPNYTTGIRVGSLDSGGQTSLATYLQNNWTPGDFVFLSIQTDPLTLSGTNNFFTFDAAAQL